MDKNQLLFELEKNIKDLRNIQEQGAMMALAIYQKQIKEIKKEKTKEIREYFANQVKYYEQSVLDYQTNIDLNIKEYVNQMDKLVEAYDYVYISVYKSMQNAINNQVTSIGNIITLWDKKQKENLDEKEAKKIDTEITALLQKKVNYSVIVEECRARLNWCIENVVSDLNKIFENKFYQMEIYKDGFFQKIKRKILNLISGKKKLLDVITRYKKDNLKNISKNNKLQVFTIYSTGNGVLKQITSVDREINSQYENAVKHVS